jgi:hypothetical protein
MGEPKRTNVPYEDRSDPDKLYSNWTKTAGLLKRGEYSLAVVRAATCIELTANIVVRRKLVDGAHLPLSFVDSLLMLANGLRNKIQKLIQPMYKGTAHEKALASLAKEILKINTNRNLIVHSGQFRNKKTAEELVTKSEQTIREMLQICQAGEVFPTLEEALSSRSS